MKKIQYTNKYNQPFNWGNALGNLGMGLLGQFGGGLINQYFQKRNPMMQNSPRMMQDMNTPSITGQNNMMNFYQQPMMEENMQMPNMVQFNKYQEPVNQTLKYIPGFPRTGGVEFGPGNFSALDYQNAITRDSLALSQYIQDNPIKSYFMGSNQDHASSAGSLSGNIQLNREWLHKLKGFNIQDTKDAAKKLNTYKQPGVAQSPKNYIQLDNNKYSLYKQPKKLYQVPDPSGSGQTGPYALPGGDPGSGGGGVSNKQLQGYANMVNFAANAIADPTKNINTDPNANIQQQVYGPSAAPISTLEEDQPITFSENFRGNTGINQLSAEDYQRIIDGSVPENAGMGGALSGGAQGAMAGAQLGPAGAIIGFAVGAGSSMWKDSKNEEARQEIRENLTAQNQEAINTGIVSMKQANEKELARFLV